MKFLRQIRIENPCHANWESMTGDDRARFCGECQKNVHDLSSMTRKQAAELFENSEGTPCVRYIPNDDGAPIYKGTKAWRNLLAAGAISLASAAVAQDQRLGDVAVPPKPKAAQSKPAARSAKPQQVKMGEMVAPKPPKSAPITGKPRAAKLGEPPVVKGKPPTKTMGKMVVSPPEPSHLTGAAPARPTPGSVSSKPKPKSKPQPRSMISKPKSGDCKKKV